MELHLIQFSPGFIGITGGAHGWILPCFPVLLALKVVEGLLPNSNIVLFNEFFPAKSLGNFLNLSLLGVQVNELSDIINVGIGAVGEHGPAAGELEPVSLEPDPILDRLLDRQLLVRHVGVPRQIPAGRPLERILVPERRRNPALQHFVLLRAMPLPVNQTVPVEPQRPFRILARGVLAVLGVTRRINFHGVVLRRAHAAGDVGGVVGAEVQRPGFGCANKIGEAAEDSDEGQVRKFGSF
nr:putative methyltransferase pmt16 [Ipomoea batatas]